jgi:hypothetical protein
MWKRYKAATSSLKSEFIGRPVFDFPRCLYHPPSRGETRFRCLGLPEGEIKTAIVFLDAPALIPNGAPLCFSDANGFSLNHVSD